MSKTKRAKYITKEVKFGGEKVTLYSIDGNTWSTRKDELLEIMERHEQEKITFGEIKGIAPAKNTAAKAIRAGRQPAAVPSEETAESEKAKVKDQSKKQGKKPLESKGSQKSEKKSSAKVKGSAPKKKAKASAAKKSAGKAVTPKSRSSSKPKSKAKAATKKRAA